MPQLSEHVNVGDSARRLVTGRFARHPDRYIELFRVIRKYELHHVAAEFGLAYRDHDDDLPAAPDHDDDHPAGLASALEELGPCFIKLGQLLSTRPDLLPADYVDALARLQSTVTPVPGEQIVSIVESELGAPIDELFQSFAREPIATASMAQVHRAVLHDGTAVVVKVQRPGVRARITADIQVLHEIARFLTRFTPLGARYGLSQIVRELEQSLTQELDFRLEAENTRIIGRQIGAFERLTTPCVYDDYTARRVLTLSFVRGRHLAQASRDELDALDAPAIARDLLSAYLKQIAIDGVFHCDPHPGNIMLADDGRLALMDFGMVGRFDAGQKDRIILLLLAFAERQGERVADTYLEMIAIPPGFDRRAFTQDVSGLVSRYHDMSGGHMALGTALLDLTRLAYVHRVPVPSAMTLLGKAMLNLDGAIRVLSPTLDPVQLIRDYMVEVMERRGMAQLAGGRMFAWAIDMKHLVENAPRRADLILEKLANNQLTGRVEIGDLDHAMRGVHSAVNRLSLGMIASSLIIGGGYVLGALIKRDAALR